MKISRVQLDAMSSQQIYELARDQLKIPNVGMMPDREVKEAVCARLDVEGNLEVPDDVAAVRMPPTAEDAPAPAVGGQAPIIMTTGSKLRVIYPPYDETLEGMVGKTVGEVFAGLQEAWSMETGARCWLDGSVVAMGVKITGEHRELQFVRMASEKGR